jgi:hypothetical protein
MHWSSTNYAKHKALKKYYAKIIDLVDRYAEAYMGKYDQLKKFPEEFHTEKDPVKYLEKHERFLWKNPARNCHRTQNCKIWWMKLPI